MLRLQALPTHLQPIAMVLDVLCHHQLIAAKGHAEDSCACCQGFVCGGVAAMAQEALDCGVAQHSCLGHPGRDEHIAGLVALRKVGLALLQAYGARPASQTDTSIMTQACHHIMITQAHQLQEAVAWACVTDISTTKT